MDTSRLARYQQSSDTHQQLSRRFVLGRLSAGLAAGTSMLAGAHRVTAHESTPTANQPAFLDQWLAVWAEDPSGADALYTEDAILEDVGGGRTLQGRDQIRAHIEEEFVAFPEHSYEVNSIFTSGNWAAAELIFNGTYMGAIPGLPPGSGQTVTLRGALIFELADGMITRESHYYDVYVLLVQIGALPAPEMEGTPTS